MAVTENSVSRRKTRGSDRPAAMGMQAPRKTGIFDSPIVGCPREECQFITSILESCTEYSMICKDLKGTILMWNEGARRLYGYEPEEVVGKANSSILYVPKDVWAMTIGGYPVIKKWLSYREHKVLGRPLKTDELFYITQVVRRLKALLLMGPDLDANYKACAAAGQVALAKSAR